MHSWFKLVSRHVHVWCAIWFEYVWNVSQPVTSKTNSEITIKTNITGKKVKIEYFFMTTKLIQTMNTLLFEWVKMSERVSNSGHRMSFLYSTAATYHIHMRQNFQFTILSILSSTLTALRVVVWERILTLCWCLHHYINHYNQTYPISSLAKWQANSQP